MNVQYLVMLEHKFENGLTCVMGVQWMGMNYLDLEAKS